MAKEPNSLTPAEQELVGRQELRQRGMSEESINTVMKGIDSARTTKPLTNYRSPPRTIQELAKEVIAIQDACNPLGVSKEYARIVQELRERLTLLECSNDTNVMKYHPILQVLVDKVADLHGIEHGLSIRKELMVDDIIKMTDDEYKEWHKEYKFC